MAAKYLLNENGLTKIKTAIEESEGISSANKLVSTDSTGRLHQSVLPTNLNNNIDDLTSIDTKEIISIAYNGPDGVVSECISKTPSGVYVKETYGYTGSLLTTITYTKSYDNQATYAAFSTCTFNYDISDNLISTDFDPPISSELYNIFGDTSFKTSVIAPITNGTDTLKITKTDLTTPILIIDSTNARVSTPSSYTPTTDYNLATKKYVDDKALVQQINSVNLSQSSWTLVSTLYEYTYSNAAFTTSKYVEIIPQNSTIDTVIAAEVRPYVTVNSGSIKMYAKNAPLGDILIDIIIMNTTT